MFHHDSNTLPEEGAAPKHSLFRVENFEIIFVALTGLSLIGVGITDFSPAHSYWYWFAMAPIFAAASLVSEWARARGTGQRAVRILRTQLLTWLGLLVAIHIVFFLLHAGRMNYENTGLVILLLLALTTFNAGIHLGYHWCLLGAFLGLTLLLVAYLEEYVWVVVFLVVLAAVATLFVAKRKLR
jgi:hypothetical protein